MGNTENKKSKFIKALLKPITTYKLPNSDVEMDIGFYPSMNLFEPSMIRKVKS